MDKVRFVKETVEVTPELLAQLFADMKNDEQARFFNELSRVASTWPSGGLPMQLQYITDDDGLELGGRMAMAYIGEYSHWGLRCESPITEVTA